MKVCDEQISFNNRKKELIDKLHDLQISGGLGASDKEKFGAQLKQLAYERKESLKKLLESSLFIHKILISEKNDAMGEFTQLGISKNEREKLLSKLNEYFGDLGKSGLKEGESFLEGSVAAIREILEDTSWGTIGTRG